VVVGRERVSLRDELVCPVLASTQHVVGERSWRGARSVRRRAAADVTGTSSAASWRAHFRSGHARHWAGDGSSSDSEPLLRQLTLAGGELGFLGELGSLIRIRRYDRLLRHACRASPVCSAL
jgi:hypothetical protein